MKCRFGIYQLDLDVEKTIEVYKKLDYVSQGCSCLNCKNFESATDHVSSEIKSFFDQIGVDIKKPAEIYVNFSDEEGITHYGGFYHICGKILKGESAWVKQQETPKTRVYAWEHDRTYKVSDKLFVSFLEECDLVEEEFSGSIVQMEVEMYLPWVIRD